MRKNLTNNELRVYKFCQENPADVYKMKIHELAERVYTTAPSISKLVKKLGFNNYQEFVNPSIIHIHYFELQVLIRKYIPGFRNTSDIKHS